MTTVLQHNVRSKRSGRAKEPSGFQWAISPRAIVVGAVVLLATAALINARQSSPSGSPLTLEHAQEGIEAPRANDHAEVIPRQVVAKPAKDVALTSPKPPVRTTLAASLRTEMNKATVRQMLERLSGGDVDGFVAALAPDYVRHCQAMPPELQEIRGREAMRAWLLANQATFPDYREDLEMLVAEGDFVSWRSLGQGTQSGALGSFPPTGRRMSVAIIGMHRFENGRIVETWTSWDNLAVLIQLGLLPAGA